MLRFLLAVPLAVVTIAGGNTLNRPVHVRFRAMAPNERVIPAAVSTRAKVELGVNTSNEEDDTHTVYASIAGPSVFPVGQPCCLDAYVSGPYGTVWAYSWSGTVSGNSSSGCGYGGGMAYLDVIGWNWDSAGGHDAYAHDETNISTSYEAEC